MTKPDDVTEEAWKAAEGVASALEMASTAIESRGIVAKAIMAATEADRAETLQTLEALLAGYAPNDPERYGVVAAIAAIRNRTQP